MALKAASNAISFLIVAGCFANSAQAQHVFVEPPSFSPISAKATSPASGCVASTTVDATGKKHYQLNIAWTDPASTTINNPGADASLREPPRDHLRLRSYDGCLTGPVIEAQQGETLFVDLANGLIEPGGAADPTCQSPVHNQPNCFNTVNLHFHGYHGSPRSEIMVRNGQRTLVSSDDIFVETQPGGTQAYEYAVGADHPAGTFWYHAHRHGSTAVQVSSGMVGPLIVRGRRTLADVAAGRAARADIDTILPSRVARERIWMFQQISYACLDPNGRVVTRRPAAPGQPAPPPADLVWHCVDDAALGSAVGTLQNFDEQIGGPGDWDNSGRYTAVNGEVQPVLGSQGEIHAGDVERWRLVHGGIRNAVNVRIVAVTDSNTMRGRVHSMLTQPGLFVVNADSVNKALSRFDFNDPKSLLRLGIPAITRAAGPKAAAALLRAVCDGPVVRHVAIAEDGLTRQEARERTVSFLQPGYRSDILVAFPKGGFYCVLDEAAPGTARPGPGAVNGFPPDKSVKLIATVEVANGSPITSVNGAADTKGLYAKYILGRITDLSTGLSIAQSARVRSGNLSEFAFQATFNAPGEPQPDRAVRNLDYRIQFGPNGPTGFGWTDTADGTGFKQHDANDIPFQPVLGSTETWRLSADFTHIHHIHVNPFQIVDILDNGASIFRAGGPCDQPTGSDPPTIAGDGDIAQFCDMKGVFKDTVFVKGSGSGAPTRFVVVVKTKYEDFTGIFVLHCHILDHEDQGMMANVCIREDGKPCVPGPHALGASPHRHQH